MGDKTQSIITSLHDAPIVPESVTPGAILTLRDNPVIPVNHVALRSTRKPALLSTTVDSDSDEWDGDVLEDTTAARGNDNTQKPWNATPYDPTDNAQFVDDSPKYPISASGETKLMAQSVERPNSLSFESDYHPPAVASIPKRQRRHRKKRRRERSTISDELAVPAEPVSRGYVEALRKATDNQEIREGSGFKRSGSDAGGVENNIESGDDDGDDNDDHYGALLRSRKRTQQAGVRSSINKILEAINDANEDNAHDEIQDGAYERGAKLLSSEMQNFLQNDVVRPAAIETDVPMQDSFAERDNKNNPSHAQVKGIKSDIQEEMGNLTVIPNGSDRKQQDLNSSKPGAVRNVKKEDIPDSQLPTDALEKDVPEKSDEVEEGTGMTGLAGTLKRLREMGQLMKKKEQIGRAKDKRGYGQDESDNDDVGDNRLQKSNVKLSYLDEFGNELTPKEAFRLLCHKFHGNAPGKNKNEKRLKKMLERMRVRNMRTDDTPLASAAALKEETRKLKSPHVVVSGVEGFANSASPAEPSQASPTENNDIKNRIVEPKVEFTIGLTKNPSKRKRLQPSE